MATYPYSKEPGNSAEAAARTIFETRGNTPRLFGNTLVFLALDKVRLQDLDEAIRRYLAWKSIVDEHEALNLDPHQVKQAETQLASVIPPIMTKTKSATMSARNRNAKTIIAFMNLAPNTQGYSSRSCGHMIR